MGPAQKFFRRRRRRRRPAGKNPDGKIAQDGNLLFQKCPSGLGGWGNGLVGFEEESSRKKFGTCFWGPNNYKNEVD